jgi:hypothetical protein
MEQHALRVQVVKLDAGGLDLCQATESLGVLIFVEPVAVRSRCIATRPVWSSDKHAVRLKAGGKIELLVKLFAGGEYGQPVLAK